MFGIKCDVKIVFWLLIGHERSPLIEQHFFLHTLAIRDYHEKNEWPICHLIS